MKKKVLLVITKSNWGGAGRYVFDVATHLSKEQFEIMVAHGGHGTLAAKLQKEGVRTISIKHLERDVSLFSELRAGVELFRVFRRERPDIVHLNSSKAGGLGALSAHLVGWRSGRKMHTIFTVHGMPTEEPRPTLARLAILLFTWMTFLLVDRIIVVSTHDERLAFKLAFVSKKVTRIYNGIEAPAFLSRDAARETLLPDSPKEEMWIGTIAESTKNKGLRFLLEAFAALNDTSGVRLVIIGEEGDEHEPLQRQAQELGIATRVSFLGVVQDAARYLKAFDLFTLPSLKEGLPYAILEAGASGVPIIATEVGGIPDIIEHEKSGLLVPSKNAAALAECLQFLVDSPSKRTRYAGALKEKVRKNFSLTQEMKRLIKLYGETS